MERIKYELLSFVTTFLAVFTVEGGAILMSLYDGEFSRAVLVALGFAVVRSVVKTVLILLFPQLFKPR